MPVLVTDTIAYVFRFDDVAQAESDTIIGPAMTPGGNGEELLVFADVTINSVTPEPGFWLVIKTPGGVQTPLFTHPNLELCFDLNTSAVLSTNVDTTHICMVSDNYGPFIQDGI